MNILSFIVGTAILWLLITFVSIPLARYLAQLGSGEPAQAPPTGKKIEPTEEEISASENKKNEIDLIPTGYFIVSDVLVLGIAGFLIGLVSGYYFIGISTKAKHWPGMIAFIIMSIVGATI